jgi:hypothetical protein
MAFLYGCAGRSTSQNGGFWPGQCASIGQAGVFTMEPGGGVNPFTARCDADGFVKVLQMLSSPSSNILLLRGGLYGELYDRPYNKVLYFCRCDADGFMKVLQIHDKPYTPNPGAFGVNPDDYMSGLVLSLNFDNQDLADASGSGQRISMLPGGNAQYLAEGTDGGRSGNSFKFDGRTVLQVAHSASLNVERQFTQSAWISIAADATGEMNIAEKGSWTGDWLSHIKVSTGGNNLESGQFYVALAGSALTQLNVNDNMRPIPKETWTHIAVILGLGRIVALYYRSSALYHMH